MINFLLLLTCNRYTPGGRFPMLRVCIVLVNFSDTTVLPFTSRTSTVLPPSLYEFGSLIVTTLVIGLGYTSSAVASSGIVSSAVSAVCILASGVVETVDIVHC